ncbi:tyrosine phosphatase family protein [Oryzibacter oryziterrae]|uniref:tyrosine phosphatase family protein n=1 Tax=Oryzibacter oryziterrae TaxID=2766474 RepID=UPI001F40547E|nr:tyrosine phosphatase family protein [Oryzibacter oryziterrae]
MIHVCSLAKLEETVERVGARHVVTLVNAGTPMRLPNAISHNNHLFLAMNDIVDPLSGMTLPGEQHVVQLLEWIKDWDRQTPLVVHCFAGISRSTAAAYTLALHLDPTRDEVELAQTLRTRSPSATPNRRIIEIADHLLGRSGRMVAAIDAIGRGEDAFEGVPFHLEVPAKS